MLEMSKTSKAILPQTLVLSNFKTLEKGIHHLGGSKKRFEKVDEE